MALTDAHQANQAQYNLDREFKLKSLHYHLKNWISMNILTGEDLGYKPGVVEKVKFEYSPLGEVFNKVLNKDDNVDKVNKYNNDLVYNSVHNFIKY